MDLSFNRQTRYQTHIQRLGLLDTRYAWARLIIFFAGVALVLLDWPAAVIIALITALIFALTVRQHRRIRHMLRQFRLWQNIKAEHAARAALEWTTLPPALPASPDRDHPFEADLDLTGDRSLHHLLDTTLSLEAGLRLRDRLLTTPPDLATIQARQTLVQELIPLTHLRDRLQLSARLIVGGSPVRRWEARRISAWLAQPTENLRRTLWISVALAACNVILFLLNQANLLPPFWIVTFLIYLALQSRQSHDTFEQATALQSALAVLVAVVQRLETFEFVDKPHLSELCRPFRSAQRPTRQLRRVIWLTAAASVQQNIVIATILNAIVPWDLFIAHQMNRYRGDLAVQVPIWLDAWFELETTSALATFAALNPACTFPIIAEKGLLLFQARGLGHPLIPERVRVPNDFALDHLGEVVLITGSNMSGKSSFLRTIGVNLCLAYAGAPVCAASLQIGHFRLFTSIHVSDSLADGFSYFYAEVRRLRALLNALEADHPLPLFFLIDEIFRGTNNQERLIGSRSYVRALANRHGVGVISTHDLELTLLPGPVNYHFEDQIVNGEMSFDYRLRPGASPTTNALKIMRLAGLPIEND